MSALAYLAIVAVPGVPFAMALAAVVREARRIDRARLPETTP